MKWDRKNKKRLFRALKKKRSMILDECPLSEFKHRWKEFKDSYGIVLVEPELADPKEVILDASYGFLGPTSSLTRCIQVPKDIAEKFLVLGIP